MNYFPTHLASGISFCNRTKEIERIIYDLKGASPILLISPRRYGKTSLALRAFEKIAWPYVSIDLYKALSEEDIQRTILNGIGQLLGSLESTPRKLLSIASDFFAGMHVRLVMEKAGIRLEVDRESRKKHIPETILTSLESIHAFVKKRNKHVILFMDEFQAVGEATHSHAIEAVIREAAQKSTHISYVFAGSNRHMMEQIFYDKKRPLYKLCDQIKLERIKESDYQQYIQSAAAKTWNKKIPEQAFSTIMELTERHPHYVNKLCSILWQEKSPPNAETVTAAWHDFVLENKSGIERELSLLSLNQRRLMIMLAREEGTTQIFSKEAAYNANLTASTIQKAISPLLGKDYVFVDDDNIYRILDPLIKMVLQL